MLEKNGYIHVPAEVIAEPLPRAVRRAHIPVEYFEPESPEQQRMTGHELMLDKLGKDYTDEVDRDSFLRSAIGVAQRFADDMLLDESENSAEMDTVLRLTLADEVTAQGFIISSEKNGNPMDDDTKASYSNDHTVRWNQDKDEQEKKAYAQIFELAGVKPRDPLDPSLMSILHGAGHEVGHIKLKALSMFLAMHANRLDIPTDDVPLRASDIYIDMHPQKAITDHPVVAKWAAEESTAEGYGMLAVQGMLETRGYDEVEIARLLDQVQLSKLIIKDMYREDRHQIDLLRDPEGMQEIIEEREDKEYLGKLGYGKPLSIRELDEQFREYGELIYDEADIEEILERNTGDLDTEAWDPETEIYIDSLEGFRKIALQIVQNEKLEGAPLHKRMLHRVKQARNALRSDHREGGLKRKVAAAVLLGVISLQPAVEAGSLMHDTGRSVQTWVREHSHGTQEPSRSRFVIQDGGYRR